MRFTQEQINRLAGPHVVRAHFLWLNLPSGEARFHNGVGDYSLDGHMWRGVTNPSGGQLVGIQSIEEPRFGAAAAVEITLSGANKAFFKSVHDQAREIEGSQAALYFVMFDGETAETIGGLNRIFNGRLTAPSLRWEGPNSRAVTITIESKWSAQNFPFGGRWSYAGQLGKYPGDKGLQYVGVDVDENWK